MGTFSIQIAEGGDCCTQPCQDVPTLNALFAGVTSACPTCVEDPSNPGTYVSITSNGLSGNFVLTQFTPGVFSWIYIDLTGGSYSTYTDSDCTDLILSTTGALVISITCTAGIYDVSATVSTGTDSVQIFFASLEIDATEPNAIVCGGEVTISE